MLKIFDTFDIDVSTIESSKIKLDDCRLDPDFYSSNQTFINELETTPLEFFCHDVFNPLVFKREFVNDKSECRYLASAEIASLEPEITYITNDQAKRLNLKVNKGEVLVTGFGTIGSIRIVDDIINGFAVANNVARLIPKDKYVGFIACFLESSFGNKLLNDHAAGAVVKYIEAPQIAKIPIPILTDEIVSKTNELYLNAVGCREKSHSYLEKAKTLVLKYNNLPSLDESEIETLDPEKELEIRQVSIEEFTSDYRLDAHFYNPMAKKAMDNITQYSNKWDVLQNISESIFMCDRFNRNYVEKEYGLPFLSGKNIIQIRPDVKYISLSETNEIDNLLVKKGWILLTRSGTLGRIGFIWNNYEEYTATEDIVRIVPNQSIDGGYLCAFLSSEYGFHQILRFKHGAVIDHLTPEDVGFVNVPICDKEKEIGDLVRKAYDLRAEAIQLEDEAQEILTKALTGK